MLNRNSLTSFLGSGLGHSDMAGYIEMVRIIVG